MAEWLKGLPGRVLDNLIATLIAVLIVSGTVIGWVTGLFDEVVTGEASLPAWALAVGLLVIFALGGFTGFWINRRREADPAAAVANRFWREAELHAEYAEHIALTLDQLQAVIGGGIPGVTLEQFIERGVLHPGRDMLMKNQARGADVRVSILVPEGEEFVMAYSAGHTPEGHARFRMRIAESFSKHAYEQGPSSHRPISTTMTVSERTHARRGTTSRSCPFLCGAAGTWPACSTLCSLQIGASM
jgi:hypothetical protein